MCILMAVLKKFLDRLHQPCLCLCRGCLGHTTRNRPLRFTKRQDEHLNLREDRT